MNPLKTFCLVACLLGAACATPASQNRAQSSSNQSLKPSKWLSVAELETTPAIDEITIQNLERMPLEEGAALLNKYYYLSRINNELRPTFVPSPSNVPTYIVKPNGQKVSSNLNNFIESVKQQQQFGDDEVTIFITGLPQESETVAKATRKLVQAYMQRNNVEKRRQQQAESAKDYDNAVATSSEENRSDAWKDQNPIKGDLVIIDLGATINSFKRFAMLDVQQTGNMIATKALLKLTNEADVPQEMIHIVAQGIAAHVAGSAARKFTELTGHKVRRITALDPSKILAKNPKVLTGLARGDADFVDAIHTSAYGMGTAQQVGDVDFYPEGPSRGVPGAENVIEASMRATRYFAESVRPGNERNFPSVPARSLQQYQNKNGHGKRAYMGIDTDFDLKGDYILEVNAKSPFGKSTPAEKQNSYHGMHQAWKNLNPKDY